MKSIRKSKKEEKRRQDWEDNHLRITTAYFELVKLHKRRPTLAEISDAAKISVNAVNRHLNQMTELKFEERFKDLRLMSGALVLSMFNHGTKGKAACAKLFFQIVEQFSEKFDHKLTGDAFGNMSVEELETRLRDLQIANRVKTNGKDDRKNKAAGPDKAKTS